MSTPSETPHPHSPASKGGPVAELVSLNECPEGLFDFNGTLGFKSEYSRNNGQVDAYVVESGEYFWGGTSNSILRGQLLVRPLPCHAPCPSLPSDGVLPESAVEKCAEEIARKLVAQMRNAWKDSDVAKNPAWEAALASDFNTYKTELGAVLRRHLVRPAGEDKHPDTVRLDNLQSKEADLSWNGETNRWDFTWSAGKGHNYGYSSPDIRIVADALASSDVEWLQTHLDSPHSATKKQESAS